MDWFTQYDVWLGKGFLWLETEIFEENSYFLFSSYGSRISATAGYVYVLRPNAEMWTRALLRRTQIIYTPDCALILMLLDVRPGSVSFLHIHMSPFLEWLSCWLLSKIIDSLWMWYGKWFSFTRTSNGYCTYRTLIHTRYWRIKSQTGRTRDNGYHYYYIFDLFYLKLFSIPEAEQCSASYNNFIFCYLFASDFVKKFTETRIRKNYYVCASKCYRTWIFCGECMRCSLSGSSRSVGRNQTCKACAESNTWWTCS